MLKINTLDVYYGAVQALRKVSLELEAGEVVALIGANGAGKTTTIKLLCGLLKADSGTITLDGKNNPRLFEVRMSLGMVPQALAIYEELSGRENLQFFGRMYGLKGQYLKKRIKNCLELAGLSERSKERAGNYSGGMKRRLNMVCSFLHEPPILLHHGDIDFNGLGGSSLHSERGEFC